MALLGGYFSETSLHNYSFEGLPRLDRGTNKLTQRSLSFQQWARVRQYLNAQTHSFTSIRLTFLVLFVYATGLRRSEVAHTRIGDLQVRHFAEKAAWFLNVVGKGGRAREVPFVRPVMNALDEYLQARGHHVESVLDLPPDTPLIALLEDATHS